MFFYERGRSPDLRRSKTQRYYSTMRSEIENIHIQLTIQGQTISSQYGSLETAQNNIKQLLHAGLISEIRPNDSDTLTVKQKQVVDDLVAISDQKFMSLRHNPLDRKSVREGK